MIETGIICDPVSANVEADQKEIELCLREFGLPINVVLRGIGMHQVGNRRLDLLIIDYGALSFGAHSTGEWQIRAACQWADNHPGSLLVLWTWFTQQLYERELKERFAHLDNILLYCADPDQTSVALKRWFVFELEVGDDARLLMQNENSTIEEAP